LITTIHFFKQATRMDKSTVLLNDLFHSLKWGWNHCSYDGTYQYNWNPNLNNDT
jgi:hypothetical protein